MARQTVSNTFSVYYILCDITGKGYVGVTSFAIEERFKRHLLMAQFRRSGFLYRAMRKHGASAFSLRLLETRNSWEAACELERRMIVVCGSKSPLGYNMTDGGEGTLGHKHTDNTRAQMAAIKTGKKATAETKIKMAKTRATMPPTWMWQSNTGTTRTPEQRACLKVALTGVKRSPEACVNLSIAAVARCAKAAEAGRPYVPPSYAGKSHSEETRARMSATNKLRWAARKAKQLANA